MGITDSLKEAMNQATKKATDYAGSHKSQIGAGVDKVGDMADKATKGKYKSQIDLGRNKAKDAVNKMGGPQETIQGEATEKPKDEKPTDAAPDQTPEDNQDATK
ncbi:antitoxin [Streptacidiphilus jiangxiensis]|uniref:MT0933-like antitoxin protein n=1 Tax=Streptacidiphilus jiangxiensis TaxID=235985 RepID=A0A1H7KK01_STRJI|nr:antitoxin [Streptacidiphilus jiangxiensis]SEK87092.1 MT0933-like antitoxin protein [Streptacidiphilus jiangxiensis]